MIRLERIFRTFNSGSPNETRALVNLDLEIRKNDFIVVVGGNGSGKSTMLNIIAGSIFQDSGKIYFEGEDISRLPDYERSKWIARIFQDPLAGTAPDLTLLENFRLASMRTKRKGFTVGTSAKFRSEVKQKIAALQLGLEDKLDEKIYNFSGGQRQALALLMAIMDETKLLLLDEPTAALDPKTSELILQLADKVIKEYGLTALLVTHNLKAAAGLGNRIIQLKEGRIIRDLQKPAGDELKMKDIFEWFTQ